LTKSNLDGGELFRAGESAERQDESELWEDQHFEQAVVELEVPLECDTPKLVSDVVDFPQSDFVVWFKREASIDNGAQIAVRVGIGIASKVRVLIWLLVEFHQGRFDFVDFHIVVCCPMISNQYPKKM
jgi:hypothetical protein